MSYEHFPILMTIPEPAEGTQHPGGVASGDYTLVDLVALLRDHAQDPEAI